MIRDPENAPRYKIDEGQEQETKILPEEQSRILSRLLDKAGHQITGEERELMSRLVKKLDEETQRIKSLKKMTVGEKTLGSYLGQEQKSQSSEKKITRQPIAGSETEAEREAEETEPADISEEHEVEEPAPRDNHVIRHTVGFKPEEVVKRYIECWNQQKFRAEYECFSKDLMPISQEEYVEARQKTYQQELQKGGMRIDFDEIESVDTVGGESEVVATKVIHQGKRKPAKETDIYRLKLENGRWVIYSVLPQGR